MKVFGRVSVIKTRYIAFFGVVGVVTLTALISVPCPVCDGTGKVSTAVGMENVYIVNLESDLMYINPDFCIGYVIYKYAVDLTLSNSVNETATGWIKLVLKDVRKGNVLDANYVGVEVPGLSTVQDSFIVWFQTTYEVNPDVTVEAVVEGGGVECLACTGAGSVPVNTWLVANGLKGSLQRVTRIETEFKPPPYIEPTPAEGY